MSGIWFTSDTHFDHARVAGLRGFASKEEHDDVLVAKITGGRQDPSR